MATENTHINDLLQIYDLTTLMKKPACYQSQNPNCIDHFKTSPSALFKHSQTIETGLSDHHGIVLMIMRSGIIKGPAKTKISQSYKKVDNKCSVML